MRKQLVTPCCLNLAAIPKATVSAMDYMILRHSWSSHQSAIVHHRSGVFTVCPRSCAPSWLLTAAKDQAHQEGKQCPFADPEETGSTKFVDIIPAEHFFEVNDAFPWQLPPADDLASPQYWKESFKPMWAAYEAFVASGGSEAVKGIPTPNIAFNVDVAAEVAEDGNTTRSVVRPNVQVLRDVDAGEELLGLFGSAWWSQNLLSRLFVAAEDDQLKHVRWIESIFTQSQGKQGSPFPLLKLCRSRKSPKGSLDVADATTRAPATLSGILAASIRKSCQDHALLRDTLTTSFGCSAALGGEVPELFTYPNVSPLTQRSISSLKQPLVRCLLRERCDGGDNPAKAASAGSSAGAASVAPQPDDDDAAGVSL